MQPDTYDAGEDRLLVSVVGEAEHVVSGFAATPRAAGANYSVDVAPGVAFVQGDDSQNQGMYLVRMRTASNVVVGGPPATGTRIDTVVIKVNDPAAGGPAGTEVALAVVAGTASGSPSPAALPATALPVAYVTLAAGAPSVTAGQITDARPRKGGNVYVSDRAPTAADGVDGDLWAVTP